MKFPAFADLDSDQKKVFSESPRDGSIMVVGPPGSGKTVIAMHRALRLSNSGGKVVLTMFNKPLKEYTANFEDLPPTVKIINLDKWVKHWYRQGFNKTVPLDSSIQGTFKPIDWIQVKEDIRNADSATLQRLNWGHLIIDEGQDFKPPMYKALTLFISRVKTDKPSLTVFADENQALNEQNCTIADLMETLNTSIDDSRLWRINKNYRNTLPIAKLSKHFQMLGLRAANLPDRDGLKPKVFFHKDLNAQIEQIVNYLQAQPNKEVLVVVQGSGNFMVGIYKKLINKAIDTQYTVQAYSGRKDHQLPANDLIFDKGGALTVLHFQSVKGLEFDTVFVIYEKLWFDLDNPGPTYKRLYVTSSRARENLFFLVQLKEIEDHPIRMLPKPDRGLCDYMLLPNEQALDNVNWFPSAEDYISNEYGDLAEKLAEKDMDEIVEIFDYLYKRSFDREDTSTVIREKLVGNDDLPSTILDLLIECGDIDIKRIIGERI